MEGASRPISEEPMLLPIPTSIYLSAVLNRSFSQQFNGARKLTPANIINMRTKLTYHIDELFKTTIGELSLKSLI